MSTSFNRRRLLIGAGGLMLALPFVEALAPKRAFAGPPGPKRFIAFFHHQGTVNRHWTPQGSGTNFTLPTILDPLSPHKSKLTVIAGLDNKVSSLNKRSNGHDSSARSVLTCQPFAGSVDASGNIKPDDQQPSDDHANGPSIDRVLAQRIRGNTPYASIDLAIGCADQPQRSLTSRVFYAGRNDPVTSLAHPQDAFDRMFATTQQSTAELARLRARRKSVLDAVNEQFTGLRSRVGREDQERLDAHASKVRDLERRLLASSAQCTAPTMNLRRPDWRQPIPGNAASANYNYVTDDDVTGPAQIDILAMAMACGLTNVGTIYFGTGHAPTFPWMPSSPIIPSAKYDVWHTMVHEGRARADLGGSDEPGLVAGYRWYTQQFAYLLNALTNARDAAGPLIDSTCVLWMSEFGNGDGHNTLKLPVVLAGNAGGTPGRFLDFVKPGAWTESDYSTNQLFTSILQGFGFPDTTFGRPGFGTGVLPGFLS